MNGSLLPLIIALVIAIACTVHAYLTEQEHPMQINNPEVDTLIFRAEAYGRYYQARHPNRDAPLSGEFADELTMRELFADIGTNIDEVDPLIVDDICDAFEDAYTEQDTDETGWKFPACKCTSWTHDLDAFERIAEESQCPAHNGDVWNDHANSRR